MLTKGEMVNFKNWDFLRYFFIQKSCAFTDRSRKYVYWVYGLLYLQRKMYKNVSLRKNVDFFISVFKKIIPDATTPTLQGVRGVTQPLI